MRFINFLLESDPNGQDDIPPDRTPEEEREHERLMKLHRKYREGDIESKLQQFIDDNHAKRASPRLKRLPAGTEAITMLGRPHLITSPDPLVRQTIKKLVAKHVELKQAKGAESTSIREIAGIVEQTKTRTPEMDKVILAAAIKYTSGQRKQKMRNGKMEDADHTPRYVRTYIQEAVHAPWPEMEALVFKIFSWAHSYWVSVYKQGPWAKYETWLLTNLKSVSGSNPVALSYTTEYVKLNKKSGWPEAETIFINRIMAIAPGSGEHRVVSTFLEYCEIIKKKNLPPALLDRIVEHAYASSCLHYAVKVGMRWPAAERSAIRRRNASTHKYTSDTETKYASTFLGGKWPQMGI